MAVVRKFACGRGDPRCRVRRLRSRYAIINHGRCRACPKIQRCQMGGIAVDAMQAVYRRPVEARNIDSPTFCHGVAGLLQVTLRSWHATRLPTFANVAASSRAVRAMSSPESASARGWSIELAPDRRADALAVAREVAVRVTDRVRIDAAIVAAGERTQFPNSVRWEPSGVAQGDAGLALLCAYL